MTPKLFSELGLSPELLKAIDKLGFEQASPIQAAAIPVLMEGKDVVGQSQTGSGKTAAFAVPAIEKVNPDDRSVQVLVLCPTRELAVQVSEEVHKLALFKRGLHALPIYGGQSYDRQLFGLSAQTYQSRFGSSRDERAASNQGCRSLVWFGTRSSRTRIPLRSASATSRSRSASVP